MLEILNDKGMRVPFEECNDLAANYFDVDCNAEYFVESKYMDVSWFKWLENKTNHLKKVTSFSNLYQLFVADSDYHARCAESNAPDKEYMEFLLVMHGRGWSMNHFPQDGLYMAHLETNTGQTLIAFGGSPGHAALNLYTKASEEFMVCQHLTQEVDTNTLYSL